MKKSSTKKKTKKQRVATISVGPKKPMGSAKALADDRINLALTRDLIVGPPLKFSKKPSFSAKPVGEHIQVEVPVVSEEPWDVSLKRDLVVSKPLKLKIKTKSKSEEAFIAGLDNLTNLL